MTIRREPFFFFYFRLIFMRLGAIVRFFTYHHSVSIQSEQKKKLIFLCMKMFLFFSFVLHSVCPLVRSVVAFVSPTNDYADLCDYDTAN